MKRAADRGSGRALVGRSSITLPLTLALGVAWLAGDFRFSSGRPAGGLEVMEGAPLALATGFGSGPQRGNAGRRPLTREPREALARTLRLRRPVEPSAAEDAPWENLAGLREVTVSKSSVRYEGVSFTKDRRQWHFLNRAVRRAIDAAPANPDRWARIVVHNSSTARGDARTFDTYHRTVKRMADGLAYHFVIGNGSYSGDGEIEVGHRWGQQLDGARPAEAVPGAAIEVCLVGDFNAERVNHAQLEALDELVDYLRAKVGDVDVVTHASQSADPASSCPGRYFPAELVNARRDRR